MAKNDNKTNAGPQLAEKDVHDLGVPMLAGSPNEPQGPEDALGPGPKRGDYAGRVGGSQYQPHTVVLNSEGQTVSVPQKPFVKDVGDAPGKGGVETGELTD